jgi:hypothetical protein
MCIDIRRRIRDAVSWKSPEKWKTNSWFLLNYNAPVHRSVLFKEFSPNNRETTLEHPPYSSHLASPDFYLFRRTKLALEGWHVCDAIDIIYNVMVELKRLSHDDFQECFKHLFSRWQKFIVAQGDNFEENVT